MRTVRRECREQIRQRDSEIRRLNDQVTKLSVKPYDDAQRKAAEDKLRKSNVTERDLLRFLLQRGRVEHEALVERCQVAEQLRSHALTNLMREGLILRGEERSTVRMVAYWEINPQFRDALRDLLFPRQEQDSLPHFLP